MALSTQTVVSDGSLVLLDISIEYLDRSEITVYFDSVLQPTGWAWVGLTEKQITFSPAVPIGTEVLIKRTTVLSDLRHEFSLGAAFTAQYLDEALRQVLHITQEAKEANFSADFYTALNLHLNQIKFLADPTDAQDAVTKVWVETAMSSQLAQATTQASNAAASASAAATSATAALAAKIAAELAEVNAETAETNAAASAAAALASELAAELAETNAAASAAAAAASATASAASYDSFDDRYLGPKAADPTLDNDGAALLVGALYYNTTLSAMRVYNGAAWEAPAAIAAGALYAVNNLSDVANAATALSNIGGQPLDTTLTAISGDTLLPTIADGSMGAFSHRNKIINGSFAVNQRGYASGAATTAGQYTLDRWKVTGAGGVTFSTTANKTTVTIPSGQAFQQIIEGLNLQSGTYTLSWEGTAQGKIGAGALGASGITGSITGGTNTTIEFGPGTVANVQLEFGTVVTPFEHRPYSTEVALCQWYFAQLGGAVGGDILIQGYGGAGSINSLRIDFPVRMRTSPTVTKYGTWTVVNCSQPSLANVNRDGVVLNTVVSALGGYQFNTVDTSTYIIASAEL